MLNYLSTSHSFVKANHLFQKSNYYSHLLSLILNDNYYLKEKSNNTTKKCLNL